MPNPVNLITPFTLMICFSLTFLNNGSDFSNWHSISGGYAVPRRRANALWIIMLQTSGGRTLRFSCSARSAFNLREQAYLRTTLSRRQLHALDRRAGRNMELLRILADAFEEFASLRSGFISDPHQASGFQPPFELLRTRPRNPN